VEIDGMKRCGVGEVNIISMVDHSDVYFYIY